MLRIKK